MDTLEDTSVTIAPPAPSGYTCTPPIPQGELTTSGTLMISSGLDATSEGEYRCVSDDVNGAVVIYLDVVGMYFTFIHYLKRALLKLICIALFFSFSIHN